LFRERIIRDLNRYTDDETKTHFKDQNLHLTQRDLVSNAINFLVAMRTTRALEDLNIWAGDLVDGLFLDNTDKDNNPHPGQLYSFDGNSVAEAIKRAAGGPIHSIIWLNELITHQMLVDARYNRETVTSRITKFWANTYETLVHAYIFAKEQNKTKAFFNNAFPEELHCTDSLISPVQTWLKIEEEIKDMNPQERSREQLIEQTKELIENQNFFIGNMVVKLIHSWITPWIIKWTNEDGGKIAPKDLDDLSWIVSSFEDRPKDVTEKFVKDVEGLILAAAKESAMAKFNENNVTKLRDAATDTLVNTFVFEHPRNGLRKFFRSDLAECLYFATAHSNLVIIFKVKNSEKFATIKKEQEEDETLSRKKKNEILSIEIETKESEGVFIKLQDYLMKEYLKYFNG
ncbi:MAG: hypothetical protein WCG04_04990, partial [Alphaproteobacteria bacterium]